MLSLSDLCSLSVYFWCVCCVPSFEYHQNPLHHPLLPFKLYKMSNWNIKDKTRCGSKYHFAQSVYPFLIVGCRRRLNIQTTAKSTKCLQFYCLEGTTADDWREGLILRMRQKCSWCINKWLNEYLYAIFLQHVGQIVENSHNYMLNKHHRKRSIFPFIFAFVKIWRSDSRTQPPERETMRNYRFSVLVSLKPKTD